MSQRIGVIATIRELGLRGGRHRPSVQFEGAKIVNDVLIDWHKSDDAEADYAGWPA